MRRVGFWISGICKKEAKEVAQCTKVLATRSHILMVEEESQLPKVVLSLLHTHWGTSVHTQKKSM